MTDWFADAVAEHYDDDTADMSVEPVVEFLVPLGGGGALELAIGTGRIALPLAARGVRVAGIDLSPDMVAQLRRKSTDVPVEIGDMTTTRIDGTFSLALSRASCRASRIAPGISPPAARKAARSSTRYRPQPRGLTP